jgi:hypothetical protein
MFKLITGVNIVQRARLQRKRAGRPWICSRDTFRMNCDTMPPGLLPPIKSRSHGAQLAVDNAEARNLPSIPDATLLCSKRV